jgi:hypothetical protein
VAQLSGVGVTWYTWLEQGRDINVSAQVVDAIARTLRLDRHEWAHLSTLAGIPTPGPAPDQCAALTPGVRKLLHQLAPYPAVVLNDRFDMLAYNATYRIGMVDLDTLPRDDHNALWLGFTNEQWKACLVDKETAQGRLVASFRSAMANHLGESAWQELAQRLLKCSPEFAEIWERHDVGPYGLTSKDIDSPLVGLLRLDSSSLWLSQAGNVRLVAYSPRDDDTAAKLDKLAELALG